MLSKGVLMDGRALEILCSRGLGEYCGVKVKGTYKSGISEQITGHAINGGAAGSGRDICISFSGWEGDNTCYVFEPLNSDVHILSDLVSVLKEDFQRDRLGPVFTAYENSLGGRVAVHGYAPWKFIYSGQIREQYINVCDWISKKTAPVRIDKCLKVIPFIKVSEDGKNFILMLVNGSLDATGEFEAEIRIPGITGLTELQKDGSRLPVARDRVHSGMDGTVLKIGSLAAWDFIIVASD